MAKSKKDLIEITPQILEYIEIFKETTTIDPALYKKYDVKRGLRDINGKGVVTGLTEISEIKSFEKVGDEMVPCEGELYYRGVNVEDIVNGFLKDDRFGFEEVTYLLLFGKLPNKKQLKAFEKLIAKYRSLPPSFVRDIIMKAPGKT